MSKQSTSAKDNYQPDGYMPNKVQILKLNSEILWYFRGFTFPWNEALLGGTADLSEDELRHRIKEKQLKDLRRNKTKGKYIHEYEY